MPTRARGSSIWSAGGRSRVAAVVELADLYRDKRGGVELEARAVGHGVAERASRTAWPSPSKAAESPPISQGP